MLFFASRRLRYGRKLWRLSSSRVSDDSSKTSPFVLHVCGAGTGVGKTVLSAGLARASAWSGTDVDFIKPIQSGYPNDNDGAFVTKYATFANDGVRTEENNAEQRRGIVRAVTLIKMTEPASPDLAARLEGIDRDTYSDSRLQDMLYIEIDDLTTRKCSDALGIVEGAGGVLSPAPSGTPQADVFRPLRLPCVLVGDPKIGGISNTLAALEALELRGYDIPAIVFFEQDSHLLENTASLSRIVASRSTSVFSAPALPSRDQALTDYYSKNEAHSFFTQLLAHLKEWNQRRFAEMKDMARKAPSVFWYPFTQHASFGASTDTASDRGRTAITAIDSAYGLNFAALDDHGGLRPMVDGIGSWWTNGVGHGHVELAKAVGAAAGRYGHVMFAEAAHKPAFDLANILLQGPGKRWASRVFFTDNGSTAVEVSLKMAFRKRARDCPSRAHLPVRVLTLKGCYHGDTLGAMVCAPQSDYNAKQTPWYEGKCLVFDPPTFRIVGGIWTIAPGEDVQHYDKHLSRKLGDLVFPDLESILAKEREGVYYKTVIEGKLAEIEARDDYDIGALLIEPVVQGAGGMRFVDPAFQRALVKACRSRGIPVVYDEVFTGIWRLGANTGGEILGVHPDIASYAKLLTGGTIPLAATLATDDVFQAFEGDSKREALLHGHSYTGHALGCAAALRSLALYLEAPLYDKTMDRFGQFWDEGVARELSSLPGVQSATMIGTMLSVELFAGSEANSGYSATTCVDIVRHLARVGIFARPLGNVIYLLCTPMTTQRECKAIVSKFCRVLEKELAPQPGPEIAASRSTDGTSEGNSSETYI